MSCEQKIQAITGVICIAPDWLNPGVPLIPDDRNTFFGLIYTNDLSAPTRIQVSDYLGGLRALSEEKSRAFIPPHQFQHIRERLQLFRMLLELWCVDLDLPYNADNIIERLLEVL